MPQPFDLAFDPDFLNQDIRLIGPPRLVMPVADDAVLVVRYTSGPTYDIGMPELAVVLADRGGRTLHVIALVRPNAEGDWLTAAIAEARRIHAESAMSEDERRTLARRTARPRAQSSPFA